MQVQINRAAVRGIALFDSIGGDTSDDWPYHAAVALDDPRATSILPVQYARAIKGR